VGGRPSKDLLARIGSSRDASLAGQPPEGDWLCMSPLGCRSCVCLAMMPSLPTTEPRPGPEGRQDMPPLRASKVSRALDPAEKDIYSYIYV
jgi:hypothetical protein